MHTKLDVFPGRNIHTDITRGEFIKMIMLAANVDKTIIPQTKIADVSENDSNYQYFQMAMKYGLIHGQTDGTNIYMRPNEILTRSEAAKIFIRAASLEVTEKTSIFSDVNASLPLKNYIQESYDQCLLHGRKTLDGEPMNGAPRVFEPNSPITVAETGKVLYNMTHRNITPASLLENIISAFKKV